MKTVGVTFGIGGWHWPRRPSWLRDCVTNTCCDK